MSTATRGSSSSGGAAAVDPAAVQEDLAWVSGVLDRARDRAYHTSLWGWDKASVSVPVPVPASRREQKGAGTEAEKGRKRSQGGGDVLASFAWVAWAGWSWLVGTVCGVDLGHVV
jgi:hypothetical protein